MELDSRSCFALSVVSTATFIWQDVFNGDNLLGEVIELPDAGGH